VPPLRRARSVARVIPSPLLDDRDGVEQQTQTDDQGDKCAVAHAIVRCLSCSPPKNHFFSGPLKAKASRVRFEQQQAEIEQRGSEQREHFRRALLSPLPRDWIATPVTPFK